MRTTSSVTSVATPDARLGQAIHSPPAGSSAALSPGSRRSSAERREKKATTTSGGDPASRRRTLTPSGSEPSVESIPSGAPISTSRAPALIPSFRASGVPEYPAVPGDAG